MSPTRECVKTACEQQPAWLFILFPFRLFLDMILSYNFWFDDLLINFLFSCFSCFLFSSCVVLLDWLVAVVGHFSRLGPLSVTADNFVNFPVCFPPDQLCKRS